MSRRGVWLAEMLAAALPEKSKGESERIAGRDSRVNRRRPPKQSNLLVPGALGQGAPEPPPGM